MEQITDNTISLRNNRPTYSLDRNKVYTSEKVPQAHVLRKEPHSLLRDIHFDSPHIRRYYKIKYKRREQQVYTVVEKICGAHISQVIANGSLSCQVVKEMIFKILKAFETIHNKGLLHRDVCLKNILIEFSFPTLTPKISGFNIYEPLNSNGSIFSSNPSYLAPEVKTYADYNTRAEIWAIGMLIYQIFDISGSVCSSENGELSTINHNEGTSDEPTWTTIPAYFKNFLRAALNSNPERRPPSMSQLNSILYRDLDAKDKISYDIM